MKCVEGVLKENSQDERTVGEQMLRGRRPFEVTAVRKLG